MSTISADAVQPAGVLPGRRIAHVATRRLAIAVALLAVALTGALGLSTARAEAYTTISGTVLYSPYGARAAGARVNLYRWGRSTGWVNLGPRATTNSAGNYSIPNQLTGYYYQVEALRALGQCFIGSGITYWGGATAAFYAGGPTARATVHIAPRAFNAC
jgi:hypothetical protein